MIKERIQKLLSNAGIGSRRQLETLIGEGRITINDKVAVLGDKACSLDKITVNGRVISTRLKQEKKTRVLLYHKPVGEICSRHDPKHGKTVFDALPHLTEGRWVSVGRLDINTSGLLIFTNDGDLAHHLMHPRFSMEREYSVRVHGEVTKENLQDLLSGVKLEDGMAKFQRIDFQGGEGSNSWYNVTLTEGKNREVRRLWEAVNLQVSRLTRIRYGDILLPRTLARGKWIELSKDELDNLTAKLDAVK